MYYYSNFLCIGRVCTMSTNTGIELRTIKVHRPTSSIKELPGREMHTRATTITYPPLIMDLPHQQIIDEIGDKYVDLPKGTVCTWKSPSAEQKGHPLWGKGTTSCVTPDGTKHDNLFILEDIIKLYTRARGGRRKRKSTRRVRQFRRTRKRHH